MTESTSPSDHKDDEPTLPDVCEISRVLECVRIGAHEKLDLDGTGGTTTDMNFVGVTFGDLNFCKRCGLLYWDPKPTGEPIVFTEVDND